MNALSKFQTTIKHAIQLEHAGNAYDFIFTINLLGEVVQIDHALLQLPAQAQTLVIGKEGHSKIAVVHNWAHFVKYMIPLEFFNLDFREEMKGSIAPKDSLERFIDEQSLRVIKGKVTQKRIELGISPSHFPAEAAVSDWMKDCCLLLGKHQQGLLSPSEIRAIMRLIFIFVKGQSDYYYLVNLQFTRVSLVPEVLKAFWLLIPQLNANIKPGQKTVALENTRTTLLRVLKAYPKTEKTKNWLLNISKDFSPKRPPAIFLEFLSEFPEKGIYDWLISYALKLDAEKKKPDQAIDTVLAVLTRFKPFFTKEIYELARDRVNKRGEYANIYIAYSILKQGGLREAEIMEEVLPWFYDPNQKDKMYSLLCIFAFLIHDVSLFPATTELIDFAVKNISDPNLAFKNYFPIILEKKYTQDIPELLYGLSKHDSEEVVMRALEWSYFLYKSEKCDFEPLPQLKSRVHELLELEDIKAGLRNYAMKWCVSFAVKDQDNSIVTKLLPLIKHSHCCLQRDSILGINTLLKEVGFTPEIHAAYMEMAKERFGSCYNGQAAIIQALQLSPSQEVKDEISQIEYKAEDVLLTLDSYKKPGVKMADNMAKYSV